MEGLPVAIRDVDERHYGVHHIVHRHDVGAADVRQGDGGQAGQPGQRGQEAEEVVRAVDLVHLAGARIADHHSRPIDAVAQARGVADQLLGLELGLVVRRGKFLGDIEIGLGVGAGEGAGHRDRRDVVQGGVQLVGQADHGAGAVDVGGALFGLAGGQVVDGGGVHHMVDAAHLGEVGELFVAEAELRGGQVADQGQGPLAPVGGQSFESSGRTASHQHPHGGVRVALQQCGDESPSDEPGTAGNEIVHGVIVDLVGRVVNKT